MDATSLGTLQGYLAQNDKNKTFNENQRLGNRAFDYQAQQDKQNAQLKKTETEKTQFMGQFSTDMENYKNLVTTADTPEKKAVVQKMGQQLIQAYTGAYAQQFVPADYTARQIEMMQNLPTNLQTLQSEQSMKAQYSPKAKSDTTQIIENQNQSGSEVVSLIDEILSPENKPVLDVSTGGASSLLGDTGASVLGAGINAGSKFLGLGDNETLAQVPMLRSKIEQVAKIMTFENIAKLKDLKPVSNTDLNALNGSLSILVDKTTGQINTTLDPNDVRKELLKIKEATQNISRDLKAAGVPNPLEQSLNMIDIPNQKAMEDILNSVGTNEPPSQPEATITAPKRRKYNPQTGTLE